jgi:mono/diheme cytochrome c family protein
MLLVSRSLIGTAALVASALFAACAATPLGATETGVNAARQKAPQGADVFARECASCHGRRGEGLSAAPNIMGAGALPLYARDPSTTGNVALQAQQQQQQNLRPAGQQTRQPFRTADDLFEYVSHWMPLPQARVGSLTPDEYWAVVNFMLVAHGVPVPPEGVNASNAKNVPLKRAE